MDKGTQNELPLSAAQARLLEVSHAEMQRFAEGARQTRAEADRIEQQGQQVMARSVAAIRHDFGLDENMPVQFAAVEGGTVIRWDETPKGPKLDP